MLLIRILVVVAILAFALFLFVRGIKLKKSEEDYLGGLLFIIASIGIVFWLIIAIVIISMMKI